MNCRAGQAAPHVAMSGLSCLACIHLGFPLHSFFFSAVPRRERPSPELHCPAVPVLPLLRFPCVPAPIPFLLLTRARPQRPRHGYVHRCRPLPQLRGAAPPQLHGAHVCLRMPHHHMTLRLLRLASRALQHWLGHAVVALACACALAALPVSLPAGFPAFGDVLCFRRRGDGEKSK